MVTGGRRLTGAKTAGMDNNGVSSMLPVMALTPALPRSRRVSEFSGMRTGWPLTFPCLGRLALDLAETLGFRGINQELLSPLHAGEKVSWKVESGRRGGERG